MNIYLIYQNEVRGYDTYDSAVVIAENEESARNTHPSTAGNTANEEWKHYGTWVKYEDRENVHVELLGKCDDAQKTIGVVVASFNAG